MAPPSPLPHYYTFLNNALDCIRYRFSTYLTPRHTNSSLYLTVTHFTLTNIYLYIPFHRYTFRGSNSWQLTSTRLLPIVPQLQSFLLHDCRETFIIIIINRELSRYTYGWFTAYRLRNAAIRDTIDIWNGKNIDEFRGDTKQGVGIQFGVLKYVTVNKNTFRF